MAAEVGKRRVELTRARADRDLVFRPYAPPSLAQVFDNRREDLVDAEDLKRTLRVAVENHAGGAGAGAGEDARFRSLASVALRYLRAKLKLEAATSHGLHDVLGGLPVLPIHRTSFLLLRYLGNSLAELLRSRGRSGASGPASPPATDSCPLQPGWAPDTLFLERNFILASSLGPRSTERLYHKYVDHLRDLGVLQTKPPAGVGDDKSMGSAFNLTKLNLNFESLAGPAQTKAVSADGFVTQPDLVARTELTRCFSFSSEDAGETRAAYVFVHGPSSAVFLAPEGLEIRQELRKRVGDLLRRSCAKISECVQFDEERAEEPKSSVFDAGCVDDASQTNRTIHPQAERQETMRLRLELAAQLRRDFDLGVGSGEDCGTGELMVHACGSVWASAQKSGLRKYYTLSEESTLIEAHVGMKQNAQKAFEACIP